MTEYNSTLKRITNIAGSRPFPHYSIALSGESSTDVLSSSFVRHRFQIPANSCAKLERTWRCRLSLAQMENNKPYSYRQDRNKKNFPELK